MYKPIFQEENINFSNLLSFILAMLRKYYKIASIFVILYVAYFFFLKDTKYTATLSFYTNYNEQPTGLSVLLQRNFAEQGFNDLNFSINNFLQSDNFYNKIIYHEYDIDGKKLNLIDVWSLSGEKPIINISQIPDLTEKDRKYILAKGRLKTTIKFNENQKTGLNVISVIIKKYPDLAIQVAEQVYNAILVYSSEVTNVKAKEKSRFIEKRLYEIGLKLEQDENDLIAFLGKNKDLNSPTLVVERDRIQRKINVNNAIFNSLSNQLELARIEEKNNTSSVFILDQAKLNDRKAGRGLFANMIILFIGIGGLLSLKDLYINRKQLFIF